VPQINSTPPTLIHKLSSITERIDLKTLFPEEHPLEVELGSGDGSLLVDLAKLKPTHNFVGVERLLGRMRKLDRKSTSCRTHQRSWSPHRILVLSRIPSAASFSRGDSHLFSRPWPKRKHRRHRLINERFPVLAHQALAPQGKIYLRTDHKDYFQQITTAFASSPLFHPMETPPDLSGVLTDFEKDFLGRGIITLRAAYESSS